MTEKGCDSVKDKESSYKIYGRPCSRYAYRVALAQVAAKAAFWVCVSCLFALSVGGWLVWLLPPLLLVMFTVRGLVDVHGDLPRDARIRAAAAVRARRLGLSR